MATHHAELAIRTTKREETSDITERVREIVRKSGIREGLCLVASTHTTAAVFVNENADPDVQRDLLGALARAVPDGTGHYEERSSEEQDGPSRERGITYRHAEGNSPAHIKTVLIGSDVTLAVRDGDLVLGRWQGVYFAELDGPRSRVATVSVSGDRAL